MSVTIRQFGGHTGSYAGDCAVVTIDNGKHSEIIVIDTGASKVWAPNELTKFVKGELSTSATRPVTLITTHFHADHYNDNLSWKVVNTHVYSAQAAKNAKVVMDPDSEPKKVGLGPGKHVLRKADTGCAVACFVPDGGDADDQNDQSMAVYIETPKFSFLSFGDMTKDAYSRLVKQIGKLPRATVTKYPHHGNFPNNYLDYYNDSLFSTAVLISGNSGSYVNDTILSLLKQNAGAIYCLARTKEAKELFQQSWKTKDKPVYLCTDVDITESGVSLGTSGTYLTGVTETMGSRSKTKDKWTKVDEDWSMDVS